MNISKSSANKPKDNKITINILRKILAMSVLVILVFLLDILVANKAPQNKPLPKSLWFVISSLFVVKKDRQKIGGQGVHNHFIIDFVAFGLPLFYNQRLPDHKQVRDDNGAKDTDNIILTMLSHRMK